MSIKIIATDLDGTLMSPDHTTITKRTYDALLQAHNMGVKTAIATGRTLGFVGNVINQIPFVDYVIYSNGASVFDRKLNKDVYTNHISPKDTAEILSMLDKMPVYYNVYVESKVYVQENKGQYYVNPGLPQAFLDEFTAASEICDNLEQRLSGKSAEIIAVYSMRGDCEKTITDFFKQKDLMLTSSIKDEIEATEKNANKGTALRGLCEKLGFDPSQVMCFGDAMNDAPMLEYADYSFAMGNACDGCKKAAKFVTLSNAEDGLAAAVEKYVLNK